MDKQAGFQRLHARLLSTKPELLTNWKQVFNSYEVFSEGNDPFGILYNSLIDAVIDNATVDYE